MIKLNQQQLAIVASALTRPDGFAARPTTLKPSAAAKLVAKLLEHGLVRELRAKGDAPVWREDEHGRTYSLKVLKAGRMLVTAASSTAQDAGADVESVGQLASPEEPRGSSPGPDVAATNKGHTKRALILALMGRSSGATLDELIGATGWLPHTTRAALTGLRKSGFAIERRRDEAGSASTYRIAPAVIAAVS